MKSLKEFFIPKNYDEELPDLKKTCFSWQMSFSSKTDLATTGQITHYAVNGDAPRGNLVLVPGLASNTEIEPLMRAVTYWSLKHKYNIYALDTFLGDFQSEKSVDLAARNTMPEYINLIDAGFEIVSKMSAGQWACVVGHSLGGIGTLEVFNRRVSQNKPLGFSGSILFAPYLTKEWCDFSKRFMKHRQYPDVSDEEYNQSPIGLVSPHDVYYSGACRYVSLYPGFYDDIVALKPRPDLMAQYDIPVTLVAGGMDRKSPIEYIRDIYDETRRLSKNKKIKFVEFPTGRHSFIDQYSDWASILRLIKTQYQSAIKRGKTK